MNLNVPDRYELFVIPPGKRKIASESKTAHSTTFTIERDDHTMGNLLKGQLLKDPRVTFAGYIMPHPLDQYILLNAQTGGSSCVEPVDVLVDSTTDLIGEFKTLQHRFQSELIRFKMIQMDDAASSSFNNNNRIG